MFLRVAAIAVEVILLILLTKLTLEAVDGILHPGEPISPRRKR